MNEDFIEKMKRLRPDLLFFDLEEEAKRLPKIGSQMMYVGQRGTLHDKVIVLDIIRMPNRHYIFIQFEDGDTLTCYLNHLKEAQHD